MLNGLGNASSPKLLHHVCHIVVKFLTEGIRLTGGMVMPRQRRLPFNSVHVGQDPK
jgi:hypothetical protein